MTNFIIACTLMFASSISFANSCPSSITASLSEYVDGSSYRVANLRFDSRSSTHNRCSYRSYKNDTATLTFSTRRTQRSQGNLSVRFNDGVRMRVNVRRNYRGITPISRSYRDFRKVQANVSYRSSFRSSRPFTRRTTNYTIR